MGWPGFEQALTMRGLAELCDSPWVGRRMDAQLQRIGFAGAQQQVRRPAHL